MKSYMIKDKSIIIAFCLLWLLTLGLPSLSSALVRGEMLNYCQTPPFIIGSVKPNLIMMLDNSASMYDLAHLDKGNLPTRKGYYCYDQTYASRNVYAGYFDTETLYSYNFTDLNFQTVGSLGSCAAGEVTKTIANTLLVCVATSGATKTVTKFQAKGNYLNWLSASKFDVEKKILTGGKYDTATQNLIAETRGCVGRKFLKEALTADYVEGGTNTSLGITFAVRGPLFTWNETIPSQGGQTYIDIYYGDYNQELCQAAVDAFVAGHDPASIKKAVDDCLSATTLPTAYCQLDPAKTCTKNSDCVVAGSPYTCVGPGGSKTCSGGPRNGQSCTNNNICNNTGPCVTPTATTKAKEQVVFGQSIQACWQYKNGFPIGTDEVNTVKNQCTDLYDENKICDGGANDGKVCSGAGDCPGGACINGPIAIRPGNASLLCSTAYAGFCATTADNWATTTWIANGYSSANECITKKHEAFCGDVQVPPVVDPSDDPSTTETYDNLPAIIGDIGIEAQLGSAMLNSQVKVKLAAPPTGLIKDFEGLIRFGVMTFNNYGSPTECPGSVPCTKICSGTKTVCSNNIDCPSGETCVAATNRDGGQVIHYIESHCSNTTTTSCRADTDCPSGEICVSPVGNHSAGLIKKIDDIRAGTWTPFAEGFYNAIGYFAKTDGGDGNDYTVFPGTSRTALRINEPDFLENKNPSQYRCQQNHVLLITDGMSTTDRRPEVNSLIDTYKSFFVDGEITLNTTAATDCPKFAGSKNLDDLAWLAKNRNIKRFPTNMPCDSGEGCIPTELSEIITTRVVFTGVESTDAGQCNPRELIKQTAFKGCGYDNDTEACYQEADANNLEEKIGNALQAIAAQSASGTAASVLASGEGTGANLIQALFYPERKQFGATTIEQGIRWTGSLKNLWYYMDPFFSGSTIMEDSTKDNILNISDDCSIKFTSSGSGAVQAIKCGDEFNPISIDDIKVLWEAGIELFKRNPTDRKIYAFNGVSTSLLPDTINTGDPLISLMQAINANEATAIARYTKGTDLKVCSTSKNICVAAADCTAAGETCDAYRNRTLTLPVVDPLPHTWKLGDIVSSTPKIVSWTPLNGYYKAYMDQSYKAFTESSGYTSRGMVFVGANDGMLHAFKLGKLELKWAGQSPNEKARLTGGNLGKEVWAFIPKNVLPYLKYMADPNYCHVYSIDATPYVFDASIGGDPTDNKNVNSWKTILIGGMRLGGACTNAAAPNGVQTPADGIGFSAYFALDITDTLAYPDDPVGHPPVLLWEFSHPDLGFATTGPAIVRINAAGDTTGNHKNGHWFVVFGSGPTGPIDTTSKQFKGYSNQNLKLFIVDLKNGPTAGNYWILDDNTLPNSFVGSMLGAPLDIHQNNPSADGFYEDDVLYFGYTQAEVIPPVATTKWTKGGVLRLLTKGNADPSQWSLSTVISDTGPVTTSIAKLQNYKDGKLWLYFGTGRYFYKSDAEIDSPTEQQKIYGVVEPCFSTAGLNLSCTTTVSESDLGNAATGAGSADEDGWKVSLDLCTNSSGMVVSCAAASAIYKPERVIASPNASSIGVVFFTTAKPSDDICSFGGVTHLWALNYKTGGAVSKNLLIGKALIQVSTGSIEQVDLKDAFTQKDDRRSDVIGSGGLAVAPPPIVVPPKAVKRTIHMRER